MLRKNKWLFLSFLILFFSLLPFYGHFWFFPYDHLPILEEDSIKNFFTFGYHVRWDKNCWHFSGFNYSYGEIVVFTDGNPFLSNIFKLFKNFFPFLDKYPVESYLFYLFFSFFLCNLIVYNFLKRLGVGEMWAGIGAFVTTYLSPQWFRIVSHFSLATSWIIPLVYLLFLKEAQNQRGKWDRLWLFLITLIGYYTHPYLGAIVTLSGGGWWGISLLSKGLRRSYWKTFLMCFMPMLLFYAHIKLIDNHPNRFPNPWGFFANQAQFETVFLPVTGPLSKCITWSSRPWEGWAYVGLLTDFIFLYVLFRVLKKWHQSRRLKVRSQFTYIGVGIPKELWNIGFVGLLLLLFSFGTGFNLTPKTLEFLGPLKHFRSLGRFAWGFYYIAVPFAFVVIDRLFRASFHCASRQKSIFVATILMIYGIEGTFNHIYLHDYSSIKATSNPFTSPNEDLKKIVQYIRSYQVRALLPLPFTQNGSELLVSLTNSQIFHDQFLISYHSGVPLMNTVSSRTSVSEIEQFYRLFSPLKRDREQALKSINLDDTLAIVIDVTHLRPIEWDFLISIHFFHLEKVYPYIIGFTTFKNLLLDHDVTYPTFSSRWIVSQVSDTFAIPPYQDYPLMEIPDTIWQMGEKLFFEYQIFYDSIFQTHLLPPLMISYQNGEKQFVEQKSDIAIKDRWIYTNSLLKLQKQKTIVIMHHIVPKTIRLTGVKLYNIPSISVEKGYQLLRSRCLVP